MVAQSVDGRTDERTDGRTDDANTTKHPHFQCICLFILKLPFSCARLSLNKRNTHPSNERKTDLTSGIYVWYFVICYVWQHALTDDYAVLFDTPVFVLSQRLNFYVPLVLLLPRLSWVTSLNVYWQNLKTSKYHTQSVKLHIFICL